MPDYSVNGHEVSRKPGQGESTGIIKNLKQRSQYLLGSQKYRDRDNEEKFLQLNEFQNLLKTV